MAYPGPSVGPWQIAELDTYIVNEIFRQIEEQVKLLRGLGPTTSSGGVVSSGSIGIGAHTHESATTGGKISHDTALTGVSADDHHVEVHTHTDILPSGVIVEWAGTIGSIPTGWTLCDGSLGTPDLRDKFIKGEA